MSKDENTYVGIILEEIRDQNKAVLEAVGGMQDKMRSLATKEEVENLAEDVKIIKAVITDASKQQQNHEVRISQLETV